MRQPKPLYFGDVALGHAVTWGQVASELKRIVGGDWDETGARDAGAEGPDGFFFPATLLNRVA